MSYEWGVLYITPNTTAIIATHVYGNPCDITLIESIAKKHGLKVINDGAHAFDVTYNNESIFNAGDISICSLHASKIYHSTEGGLIALNNHEIGVKLHVLEILVLPVQQHLKN